MEGEGRQSHGGWWPRASRGPRAEGREPAGEKQKTGSRKLGPQDAGSETGGRRAGTFNAEIAARRSRNQSREPSVEGREPEGLPRTKSRSNWAILTDSNAKAAEEREAGRWQIKIEDGIGKDGKVTANVRLINVEEGRGQKTDFRSHERRDKAGKIGRHHRRRSKSGGHCPNQPDPDI
jgi:hypothetical protein